MTTTSHEQRMALFSRAGLYLVTSESLSAGRTTLAIVKAALRGGARLIQLREKEMPLAQFIALADEVRTLTRDHEALLIINDRIDIALAVEADGVHLGQDDFPVRRARALAPDLIIGASSHTVAEAVQCQNDGASYVNIGPLFPTTTKVWPGQFLGLDGLQQIRPHVHIPFSVMGGIKEKHIPALVQNGATAIALVTAVTQAADPEQAVRSLLTTIMTLRN